METHFQVQLLQGEEWTGEEVSEIIVRRIKCLGLWRLCNVLFCLGFLSVLTGVFTDAHDSDFEIIVIFW